MLVVPKSDTPDCTLALVDAIELEVRFSAPPAFSASATTPVLSKLSMLLFRTFKVAPPKSAPPRKIPDPHPPGF